MQPSKNIQWSRDGNMFLWNSFMFLQTDDWFRCNDQKIAVMPQAKKFFSLYNKHNRGEKSVKTFHLFGYDHGLMY